MSNDDVTWGEGGVSKSDVMMTWAEGEGVKICLFLMTSILDSPLAIGNKKQEDTQIDSWNSSG